jgi:hypothetical protein
VPQNEGQHLQSVYPRTNELRGVFHYAYMEAAQMTETSESVSVATRRALLDAWSPYWRLTASRLVEKSPRHSTMTRFLQATFSPAATVFVATMRHPLACAHYMWGKHYKQGKSDGEANDMCGATYIDHWLRVYDVLMADMEHLDHVKLVQFETFMGEGFDAPLAVEDGERLTQEMCDALFRLLGVPESVRLDFVELGQDTDSSSGDREAHDDDDDDDGNGGQSGGRSGRRRRKDDDDDDDDRGDGGQSGGRSSRRGRRRRKDDDDDDDDTNDDDDGGGRGGGRSSRRRRKDNDGGALKTGRRLLEYHGDWHHLRLQRGSTQAWVEEWLDYVDMSSTACQSVIAKYEARVNAFGYSLRDLKRVWLPASLQPHYLHVPELLKHRRDPP